MLRDREVITVKKVTICKKRFFFSWKVWKAKQKKKLPLILFYYLNRKKYSAIQKQKAELKNEKKNSLIFSQCVWLPLSVFSKELAVLQRKLWHKQKCVPLGIYPTTTYVCSFIPWHYIVHYTEIITYHLVWN